MANKPGEANFFPDVPQFPSMGTFQPVYGKFDLTTYMQGASDYEIMAFLVGKYNACLEAYGTVTKLSTETVKAAHQLQDWINSWFTNLDVQQELNNKIDSMVQDGSFGQLLHQTFDTQVNQQTANAATAWLVANVTPTGSTVVLDKSLTIEGAAADAKAVGEKFGSLTTDFEVIDKALFSGYNIFTKLIPNYYFNVDQGYNSQAENWSVTELIPIIDYQTICITIGKDTRYNGFFDDSKKFISGFQLYAGENTISIPSNAKYFCVSSETDTMQQVKYWNEKSTVYLETSKVNVNNIIGGQLDFPYEWLNGTRQTQLKMAYDLMLAYYKESPNTIPLFVSTDNHMDPNPQTPQKYINNIDKDGMEINNINLGDSFVDHFTDKQAKELIKIMQYIKNYIGVTGNHEIQGATNVSQYYLRRAFGTTNLHREVIKTNYRNCYVTFDDLRRVKFIVIDPYTLDSQSSVKYIVKIDTNTANWLLEELSNDSERDIVVLMHQPLTSRNIHRDGTLQQWTETEDYLTKMEKVFNLLKDRKNKRSGTYVDDDGVSHNYNFSTTKSDLLCIINGHSHEELYLIEDGLTTYVCDWEGFTGNKSNTYIIIDRNLKKMVIYKVGPDSLYPRLDLSI